MYLNKAIIIGNLTRDPESRALPSGVKVTSFSLATNRVWKDKTGQRQEDTQYHNVVVFGPQAETVSQYLRKGSSALVEGRMQTRSWDGQDGKKQYRTEIVADRVQFGPRASGGGAPTPGGATAAPAAGTATATQTIEYPEEEINPEDIPF
jgi:single-strand DNA-binding protein